MREKIRVSLPFEDFFFAGGLKACRRNAGNEGDLVKNKTLAHPV